MRRLTLAIGCLFLLGACTPSVFPYKALEGIDLDFDFSQWLVRPHQDPQKKIQLGGRILHATQGDVLQIVAAQLPITKGKEPPEPIEGTSGGEFVIVYRGMIEPAFLHIGNRLMVVGQTSPPTQVEVDRTLRHLPTVMALCIHFWSTGGILIQGSSGAPSRTVKELTYCKMGL
jgi:starvation-inducible outer membrane lipoprotein